jgi:hypothetical protein
VSPLIRIRRERSAWILNAYGEYSKQQLPALNITKRCIAEGMRHVCTPLNIPVYWKDRCVNRFEKDFKEQPKFNSINALSATFNLGMGIDIGDLNVVGEYQRATQTQQFLAAGWTSR